MRSDPIARLRREVLLYVSPGPRKVRSDLLESVLTAEERKVIDGPPVWEIGPPQREDYSSDSQYALALRDYARRVIVAGVMES